MKKIYRKLTEAEVDKKDIEILNFLATEKKFTDKDYEEVAEKTGISTDDAKKRLDTLREKKILLKDKVSILDQVRIWDGYYIMLVKAAIQPPVIGIDTKFPSGWVTGDYLEGLKAVEKEMSINVIRHAYVLQGTEWDIMVIVSAKSQDEIVEYFTQVSKQGWISKVWSFTPTEWKGEWIFDPIAAPDPSKTEIIQKDVITGKNE